MEVEAGRNVHDRDDRGPLGGRPGESVDCRRDQGGGRWSSGHWVGGTSMSAFPESHLSNKDLAPTGVERRTWGTYNLAALWIGLSIVITTYTLASGLIAAGMTWWQGLLTVSLGNFIVLIPILLNSHPGTKYGIPFPVLVRSSF